MIELVLILLGAFWAFLVCLDICFSKKNAGAFTRYGLYIIGTVIPAFYNGGVLLKAEGEKFLFFYPSFFITIAIIFIAIYHLIYKKIHGTLDEPSNRSSITIFDFLYNGYGGYQEKIKSLRIEEGVKRNQDNEAAILNLQSKYGNEISQFIVFVLSKYATLDNEEFIVPTLYGFQKMFFGDNDARFTLRQYHAETNSMNTFKTTRLDKVPGIIPLDQKNLIMESFKSEKPIIFSRNKINHFDTENGSVKNGVYDDYVSHCINVNNNLPAYSVCMDVRGIEAGKTLRALVDSGIFTIVCLAIAENITIFANKNNN